MKSTMTALAAVLVSTAFGAAPAHAQQAKNAQAQQAQEDPAVLKTHTPKVSRQAAKAMQELQKAVKENNTAAIPAALAAAQEAAKTPDDRYAIGIMQLQTAVAASDSSAIAAAIETMLASGAVTEEEKFSLYFNLGQSYASAKQNDRAAQAYEQALQLNPSNIDATAGLAEVKAAQGKSAEAVALIRKGIALQTAGGARPSEAWFKRALQFAYNAKLSQAVEISREWVNAYPTSANWKDALAIYQNFAQLDETQMLDLLRLKRAAGALAPAEYLTYGALAVPKGLAGEAKAVLDEGIAANAVKSSDPEFKQIYALASDRSKGDRESLPAAPEGSTNARQTMIVGDAYYGYGDYAKAVEFYRAALGKPGADANLINLHIGMALARQGDKAGAQTALNSVTGPYAELAKYWQLYASARA